MSSSDQHSRIATLLDSLEEALDEGNPSDVLAFLRVLRMNGIDDQRSADLVSAFAATPQPSDLDTTRQWIADHRERLNETERSDDSLLDFDFDADLDDIDSFGDFEELEGISEISDFDDVDDLQEVEGLDDFDDFDDFDLNPDHTERPEDGESEMAPSGDTSQVPFSSGHTPAPGPTTGQLPNQPSTDSSSASATQESETSKAITGEREFTRQMGPDHLRALSEASNADSSNVFDHPTRRQFQAPAGGNSPTSDAPSDGFAPGEIPAPLTSESHPSSAPPESEVSHTSDDADDLDFDFDLGPTASATPDPFQSPSSDIDAPVADMDYAPPPAEQESFFPPPLTDEDDSSPSDDSSRPGPFPQSPSAAASPPSEPSPPNRQTPQRRSQKTPLADMENLGLAQASSPQETAEHASSPLSEDELLALGEELSSSQSRPRQPTSTAPGVPSSSSTPASGSGYRGEPMLPDDPPPASLGNEPTPAHDGASPFSQPQEPSNPFDAPAQSHKTPAGAHAPPAKPLTEESSFFLEEVDESPAPASDPQDDDVTIDDAINRARALYEQGEFDTAMELVEAILELEANDDARQLHDQLVQELERKQADRLGSLARTPRLQIPMGDIAQLDLDHRGGFLLSQIDGVLTFEDILDMSAMDRLETLTLLADLYEQEIIGID